MLCRLTQRAGCTHLRAVQRGRALIREPLSTSQRLQPAECEARSSDTLLGIMRAETGSTMQKQSCNAQTSKVLVWLHAMVAG